jgi:hypothetical protein
MPPRANPAGITIQLRILYGLFISLWGWTGREIMNVKCLCHRSMAHGILSATMSDAIVSSRRNPCSEHHNESNRNQDSLPHPPLASVAAFETMSTIVMQNVSVLKTGNHGRNAMQTLESRVNLFPRYLDCKWNIFLMLGYSTLAGTWGETTIVSHSCRDDLAEAKRCGPTQCTVWIHESAQYWNIHQFLWPSF